MSLKNGKTLVPLPGTACDYQTDFSAVPDRSYRKREKESGTRDKLKSFSEMSDGAADRFVACFARSSPESIKNEYYSDLLAS